MSEPCLFCDIPRERVILKSSLAYVIRDGFPVTELHSLVIPKRHVPSYFDLTVEELNACNLLLQQIQLDICKLDSTVTGFNIGVNVGTDAGQTIFHCHIHLIPRRAGDVENPRGGIRHLVPGKGLY